MLNSLIKITQKNQIFPFYHLVSDSTPAFIKHLYKPKNTTEFKRDLSVFLQYFESVSLTQTIKTKNYNSKNKTKTFHLTFDDGLSNFYHIIAPILLKKGIHATVFLNTTFIDNKDLFYRYKASLLIEEYLNADAKKKAVFKKFLTDFSKYNSKNVTSFLLNIKYSNKDLLDKLAQEVNFSFTDFLQKEKPYLSTKQIKELQAKGFTFGAHSVDHPLYQNIDLNQQIKQTIESINTLKEKFNIAQPSFAFPFYDSNISLDFFNAIKNDVIISFGTSGLKTDQVPFNIQRLDMEKNTGNTKLFLTKGYFKLFLQQLTKKHLIKRN